MKDAKELVYEICHSVSDAMHTPIVLDIWGDAVDMINRDREETIAEHEGLLCPEDVGCAEYIAALKHKIETIRAEEQEACAERAKKYANSTYYVDIEYGREHYDIDLEDLQAAILADEPRHD